MFKKDSTSSLVFIKSNNISVFPCSRRRSTPVSTGDGVLDRYFIPFDPEARLNTEHNNRRHTGLNGYKQDYIYEWNEQKLSIVIAGYLFEIKLDESTNTPGKFGTKVAEAADLDLDSDNVIYAQIALTNVIFLAQNEYIPDASTPVLRNQTNTQAVSSSLDILLDINSKADDTNNYYFTGLSFTTNPESGDDFIYLKLLKYDNTWQIYEPSRLPAITHGDTENSVSVNNLEVTGDILISRTITENNESKTIPMSAASIKLKETATKDVWQLQIFT